MAYLWIIIGVVAIAIGFFLAPQSVEIWPSLDTAGIIAAVYSLALIIYTLRSPVPVKHRIIVGVICLFYAASIATHWIGTKNTTSWQQSRLQEIHSIIQRGIIKSECPQRLLAVLEKYHNQGKVKKVTLGNLFVQTYPGTAVGSNIYKPYMASDSMRLFITQLNDSMITITASHAFSKGRNPDFASYWGRKGTVQERFILTSKGVSHESDN
jgi:hypothetical protein